jgi:hypothetical protein
LILLARFQLIIILEFSETSQRELCRRIAKFPEDEVLKFVDTFEAEISVLLREKLGTYVTYFMKLLLTLI